MNESLVRLCAAHGIEPSYTGMDGVTRDVPADTLAALAAAFGVEDAATSPPPTIAQVRAEPSPRRCYVPADLANARVWGITCQLSSLVSTRNLGMGDFADLAALCRVAASEGADFVGVNPLHALFWSDPGRVSPFSPSNRRFLNPLYLALDWVDGFSGLADDEQGEAARARAAPLVDVATVARLKGKVLNRLFARFPWTDATRAAFRAFCDAGGDTLSAHAVFEAISQTMVASGHGATPPGWPEPLRRRSSPEVAAFMAENRAVVDYHLWLQWLAQRQLERVQREACCAGMRIGLYLDCAVGAAPEGSAVWTDPTITLPGVAIGAPPDPFSVDGQDWGLAPLSPLRLAALDGQPLAEIMTAVMHGAGAVRIDHAMGLARLWLIPHGARPTDGAYVRYPLSRLLARLAEVSQSAGALVIGEDLGLVPPGFRELMADRAIHSYKVFFFERDGAGFADPKHWPADALACVATHDMPTFAGWWNGTDLEIRASIGLLSGEALRTERESRSRDRQALIAQLQSGDGAAGRSVGLHAYVASSPCRLAALQIEDALGLTAQVNIPGTVSGYPNWRRCLPVAVDRLCDDSAFAAHTAAMRSARPR